LDDIQHINSNFEYVGPLTNIWIKSIVENPVENMILSDSRYDHIDFNFDKFYMDMLSFIYVSKTTKNFIFEAYGNNVKITVCENDFIIIPNV
jgi:hypothetical protein